jgi:hypothetical protein
MSGAAARREHRRLFSCNHVGDWVLPACHNDGNVVRPPGAGGRLHELTMSLMGLR